jgi:alcohol dehydrogenase (NADP+)
LAVGSFAEQYRLQHGSFHTGPGKAYATLAELWDEDVSYMEGRDFEQPEGFVLQ